MKKKKLVRGVGINNADYVVTVYETIGYENGKQKRRVVWRCPFYSRWNDMLARCYTTSYKQRFPTYEGCCVCKEWLTFSNFKAWMEKQDWEGKELDKDLLVPRNKVYSPETCVFVDKRVNLFLTESSANRGGYMIGVSWKKVNIGFKQYVTTVQERVNTSDTSTQNSKLTKLGLLLSLNKLRFLLLSKQTLVLLKPWLNAMKTM